MIWHTFFCKVGLTHKAVVMKNSGVAPHEGAGIVRGQLSPLGKEQKPWVTTDKHTFQVI